MINIYILTLKSFVFFDVSFPVYKELEIFIHFVAKAYRVEFRLDKALSYMRHETKSLGQIMLQYI